MIARGSTARYASGTADVRAVGGEIGARYVMEGSLRHAAGQLRVAVQLVDATTGAHLWAETYNRPFDPNAVFALQDDLVPRIVSTCADHFGVLARAISEAVRSKPVAELGPYEALMRGFGYHFRLSPEEHAEARAVLERAVAEAPANADCWAMLSWVYSHEHAHGFNPRPGSLDRALDAARRAVDLAPANHVAQQALAVALFFRKDRAGCLSAAERAIALNPLDGSNEAFFLITFTGDWERGTSLIRRAMELNPHHPRWYELILGVNEYRLGRYRAAVDEVVRANLGESLWTSAVLAAAHAQLGDQAAAGHALRELLAQGDDVARSTRELFEKWFDPPLVEHLMDGLRKAGLTGAGDARPGDAPAAATARATTTGASPSVAVLPFANLSADKEQEYFSDGLAEEVITLLSQVAGLKVIARTSSFAFRGKDDDVRRIAAALDVTHVLEGSVRRAGTRVRVTTQLVAAADGRQVWSERFDRELSDIFAVQDEIATAIAGALRLTFSTHGAPQRYTPALPAYEAYLKGRHHQARVTPDALEEAKRSFESAIALDPRLGLAHVGVAAYWVVQMFFGSCRAHDAVPAARAAAGRALEVDPSIPEAHALLGYLAALYDLDWTAAARHFEMPATRQVGLPGIVRPMWATVLFQQEQGGRGRPTRRAGPGRGPARGVAPDEPARLPPGRGPGPGSLRPGEEGPGDRPRPGGGPRVRRALPRGLGRARAGGARSPRGIQGGPVVPGHDRHPGGAAAAERRRGRSERPRRAAGLGRGRRRQPRAGGLPHPVRRDRRGGRLDGEGDCRARPGDDVLPAFHPLPAAPDQPAVAPDRRPAEPAGRRLAPRGRPILIGAAVPPAAVGKALAVRRARLALPFYPFRTQCSTRRDPRADAGLL